VCVPDVIGALAVWEKQKMLPNHQENAGQHICNLRHVICVIGGLKDIYMSFNFYVFVIGLQKF
jgi:hypothetical protein